MPDVAASVAAHHALMTSNLSLHLANANEQEIARRASRRPRRWLAGR